MGGKSSSSSSNSTTNNYTSNSEDNRVVTGQGGSALIAREGSSVVNNVLDGGAVALAVNLAKSGRELANKEFGELLNSGQYLVEKAYKDNDANRAFLKETLTEITKSNQQTMKDVGSVYQSAREQELTKETAGTKQLLTVAGFAVVGLAALQALK